MALMNTSRLLSEKDPFQWVVRYGRADLLNDLYNSKIVAEREREPFGRWALQVFRTLANETTIETGRRIHASSAAASLLNDLDDNSAGARDLLIQGVNLLPEAILLHSNRLEQLQLIREFHYLPSGAAATSLAAGDSATTAIQLFERGRALIWDRLLSERTPINDLLEADNESLQSRGKQFERLREEVFQPATSIEKPMELTTSLEAKDEIPNSTPPECRTVHEPCGCHTAERGLQRLLATTQRLDPSARTWFRGSDHLCQRQWIR